MTFAAPRLQILEQSSLPKFNAGLRDLFATLDDLLGCGGDPRLMLDPIARVNDYGCGVMPSPQTLSFSSSTASTISERAYERAGLAREELMRSAIAVGLEEALETRIEEMREELKSHLGLGATEVDVAFSPSGTDSQLHALFVTRALLGEAITTILVGSDQTGSGTAYTARGRHFNRFTASGTVVRKDTSIAGLEADCITLPLADATGLKPRADADLAVIEAIEAAVARGARVLLQIMDASKLGWHAPSEACLDEISRRWPGQVQVVVDACQMRLSRRRLETYLDRGYMVLITGSKFFGGPAFSGALLFPATLVRSFEHAEGIAGGLVDYASRSDWPKRLTRWRSRFESRPNIGQWLRWEAALSEMTTYYGLPAAFRTLALRELGRTIASLIALSPSLRPVPCGVNGSDAEDEEFAQATIFPFTVHRDGDVLSATNCRLLHRALMRDCGELFSDSPADRAIAAQPCLVGQPVRIERQGAAPTAVLRLCVGARLVAEAWSSDEGAAHQNLLHAADRVAGIIAKIELLLAGGGWPEFTELTHGN